MNRTNHAWALVVVSVLLAACGARADELSADGVHVTYNGISKDQATALAQTLSAARTIYTGDFGLDMPQTVELSVECAPGNPTRLFNDGRDRINLSIASPRSLAPPVKSGTFTLYGMCHELGHVGMYRTLTDRDWLTGVAAEGWAHYAGSVVVDGVYAARGEKLWPEPYDYRADGTQRLDKQLKAAKPSEIDLAAAQWRALDGIIGHKGFPKLFTAWQKAQPDLSAPSRQLRDALLDAFPDKKQALETWWSAASPLLVQARPASGFAKATIDPSKLEGRPQTLKGDDDAADGKRSIAGGGHARLFEAPGEGSWYLRSVSIHGARYGGAAAPPDQFDLALCDADMHPIVVLKEPYKAFERGQSKWVKFDLRQPTLVPAKFNVVATFRPTARNGVFVDFDSSTTGRSRVATPGATGEEFKQGDWMIRVEVDRAKGPDALGDK